MITLLMFGICRSTSEGPDGTDMSKSHDGSISFN
jgi:hypothetical protein